MALKSKKRSLADSMQEAAGVAEFEEKDSQDVQPQASIEADKPKSRKGTRAITGHFSPEVQMQLKILAAEKQTTNQELIREGLNMVFQKYGKPPIA